MTERTLILIKPATVGISECLRFTITSSGPTAGYVVQPNPDGEFEFPGEVVTISRQQVMIRILQRHMARVRRGEINFGDPIVPDVEQLMGWSYRATPGDPALSWSSTTVSVDPGYWGSKAHRAQLAKERSRRAFSPPRRKGRGREPTRWSTKKPRCHRKRSR